MRTHRFITVYLALVTISYGNACSGDDLIGFSFDQAMLESSLEAAEAEGVLPVAFLEEPHVVLNAPTNQPAVDAFEIQSVSNTPITWRRLDRWRFGIEFVSLSRGDEITFNPSGVVAESGVNSGLSLSARVYDRPNDPNSDAWEGIFRYAAGKAKKTSPWGYIATSKASLLDLQLNRRLTVHSGTRSAALKGGLRAFSLDDSIDFPFFTTFRAESQNLLAGAQVGIDSHWQPSRFGFGGGVTAGVYANSGESVTTYRPPHSSSALATTIELDINTTYQVSETTHLMVGLYLLGISGIQSARDAASYEPDDEDTISYGGLRFALARSSW
jgi:hypothetical protein